MTSHACGWLFPNHKWGKWRKPLKRGINKGYQFRYCLKCGEAGRRKAKAPRFHIHRWHIEGNRAAKAKATEMTCKVIGCNKTKPIVRHK